ncbi:hypothetical protein N9N99_02340 [Gammaproteobacteria bacterium]|nr:hypothetical protein [Gammaproteobacteria bacterium]
MKKLSLLPIILLLVACQPSELERCVKANGLMSNDYLDKEIELEEKLKATANYDQTKEMTDEQIELVQEWSESLNTVEFVISDCIWESKSESSNPEADYIEDLKPRVKSCITANKDEIENLILESKNTATSICNAQGIY